MKTSDQFINVRRAPEFMMLAILVHVAFVIGCKKSSSDHSEVPATTGSAPSSHETMLAYVSDLRQLTADNHPYVGSFQSRQLKQTLANLPADTPVFQRWKIAFQLGQSELRLGSERDAIENFLWCRAKLDQISEPADKRRQWESLLMFQLGVAYMRLAETQNCCLRNEPESCILPIRGKGVHTNSEGSQKAIECFMHVLNMMQTESETYRKSQWLLNIAWMTLGEYPNSVPKQYLIPPASFASKEPLVRFVNIAQKLNLDTFSMCGGAIIDDFDNDNYLDLIVSSWDPRDPIQLFRNQQDGTFANHTKESGLDGFCGGLNLVQADYDNDDDVDVLVLRGAWLGHNGRHPNSLMRNNGDGTFTDVTLDIGMEDHYPTQTAAWGDFDNDGDLDLYVGNESSEVLNAPCQLYRNEGDGTFRDVARFARVTNDRYTKAVIWGDYNGDRYPDLYVSNDRGRNRLYRNNRDGTFSDVAEDVGVTGPELSFPAWFWDFDNDGHLDIYVSAYAASIADLTTFHLGMESDVERSRLYRGNGQGGFIDVAKDCGLIRPDAAMGANFGDLDNDGYLDFYLGTGYPDYDSLMPSVMYLNRGGKRFVDVTTAGGFGHLQKGHAVAFADLDHDGDQDVFEQMGGAYPGDRFHDALYENPGLGNHWITIRLIGTESNRSAIGARICVDVSQGGATRRIYRHVNSGGSFGANPLRQTVGLGSADRIEKLEVYWPTTDRSQTFEDVPMDRHFVMVEGENDLTPLNVVQIKLRGSN